MSEVQAKKSNDKLEQFVPLGMLLMAALFGWLSVQAAEFQAFSSALSFGIMSLAVLVRQSWLVLFAVGVFLFFKLGGDGVEMELLLGLADVVMTIFLLAYMQFSFRFCDMSVKIEWNLSSKPNELGLEKTFVESDTTPFTVGWYWIPVAMILAFVMLVFFPFDATTNATYRITPSGMRAIRLAWFLGVSWAVAESVFRLLSSGQRDSLWAAVFSRSEYCREVRREMHGIEARRKKRKFKLNRNRD